MLTDPRPADAPSRKVVVLVADAGTNADMRRWCELQGFDLGASFGGEPRDPARFKFHVTLFATVGPSALPEQSHPIEYLLLDAIGFDAFGPERRTPVALLAPVPRLVEMREAWLALADAEPTYPEFRPHLTLSYAWDGQPALENLPMINLALGFGRLEVRTLKEKPDGKGARVQSFKNAAAGTMTVEQLAAKLPEYRTAVAVWEVEVDDNWNFDFTEFGENAEEVQAELESCREAVAELTPLASFGEALSPILAAAREHIETLVSEYEELAATAAMALDACTSAQAQLTERLAGMKSTPRRPATKSYDPIDLSLEPVVRAAFEGDAAAQVLIAEHDKLVIEAGSLMAEVAEHRRLVLDLRAAAEYAVVMFQAEHGRTIDPSELEQMFAEHDEMMSIRDALQGDLDARLSRMSEIERTLDDMLDQQER